jgi:hypothetical protein
VGPRAGLDTSKYFFNYWYQEATAISGIANIILLVNVNNDFRDIHVK